MWTSIRHASFLKWVETIGKSFIMIMQERRVYENLKESFANSALYLFMLVYRNKDTRKRNL
jgi:hypothetical protein